MTETADFTLAEREHYNRQAAKIAQGGPSEIYQSFFDKLENSFLRQPYSQWLSQVKALKVKPGFRILDLGTGQGHHAIRTQLIHPTAVITGVDISSGALAVARKLASEVCKERRPEFLEADAHALPFPEKSFDCILDFGSFSSLNFERLLSELGRLLKPGGKLIAIETFGHNPLTNLKRRVNQLRGSRTNWAVSHILDENKVAEMKKSFASFEVAYFGLTTLVYGASPIKVPRLLRHFESMDDRLIHHSNTLRRWSFKVVITAEK